MKWEEYASRVLAICRIGQKYSKDPYALENYQELEELSLKMMEGRTEPELVRNLYVRDVYPTPSSTVRVLVFNPQGRLLMVKEDDGGWAVPGGWCEVFYSLQKNAVKEVFEEAGIHCEIQALIGVFQREKYKDYPTLVSEYVHYFWATTTDETLHHNHEVSEAGFFDLKELPPLSRKNTEAELRQALAYIKTGQQVPFD